MKIRRQTPAERGRVVHGSGNVFADAGFSASDSAELQVKAELTRQISRHIKLLALTQTQAAERLGVNQPDVSKLLNGRFTGYSVDRLMALLNALEVDVDIVLRPRSKGRAHRPGIVRVMSRLASA